jgi:hypothetical protein
MFVLFSEICSWHKPRTVARRYGSVADWVHVKLNSNLRKLFLAQRTIHRVRPDIAPRHCPGADANGVFHTTQGNHWVTCPKEIGKR